VTGEIDLATAERLRAGLLAILEEVPMSGLDLDLSAVDFCDCTGLGALMTVHKAAARVGCGITISAARPGTSWLLELTGLGAYFAYPPAMAGHHNAPVEHFAGG
jgi:anti-anti-sigma factor